MESLKRFPFILVFLAVVLFLGYQYYEFQYASDGQYEMHQIQLKKKKDEVAALKKKLEDGQKFLKNLEAKKDELRSQVKKLSEYQDMLSEGLDVPALIKMLLTETKKIQLRVDRIEPGRKVPKEYYLEQEFKMDVKGSYSQMILFAQRVSQLQKILRIEAFSFKPSNAATAKITNQLDGQFSVRAYQYTPSKEDVIARPYK